MWRSHVQQLQCQWYAAPTRWAKPSQHTENKNDLTIPINVNIYKRTRTMHQTQNRKIHHWIWPCIKGESNPRRVDGNDPGYHYPINAYFKWGWLNIYNIYNDTCHFERRWRLVPRREMCSPPPPCLSLLQFAGSRQVQAVGRIWFISMKQRRNVSSISYPGSLRRWVILAYWRIERVSLNFGRSSYEKRR